MRSSLPASKFRAGLILATVAASALTISACSGRGERPRLAYEERPVEALYNTGYQRLQSQRWADAIDYFQEVERQHPYSEWSRRAILMQIYAHYQNSDYPEAIAASDRFIQLFPGNPSAPYAFYMKALCNFEQITDVGRDQGYAQAALDGLRDVQRR
ncbi:MAG: outer membrane protein assembly factor BamD, partial [Brevundimonas sp.]